MLDKIKKFFAREKEIKYVQKPETYFGTADIPKLYKTLEDRTAKHKTEYAWLFEPTQGLQWDFDPVTCRELGTNNAFVSMMVDSIVKEVSGAPWQIVKSNTEISKRLNFPHNKRKVMKSASDSTAEEITTLLTEPDPDHDYQDWIEKKLRDDLTVGSDCAVLEFPQEAYDGEDFVGGVPPVYIRPSDPITWCKHYKDSYGIVSGYWQYSMKTMRQTFWSRAMAEPTYFDRKEILWDDFNHYSFSRYGHPPTLSVLQILMSLDYAINQEQEYLSRGSIPSGALNLQNYDIEEAEDFKEKVMAETKGKPHKWLVIAGKEGDVNFIPFSYNFKEFQFLERMEWYVKALASVFQVPTSVVGMNPEQVNYATFKGERGNFEANTLAPYLQRLERHINRRLIWPYFGRDYQYEVIPGMSEETRRSISSRVVQEWNAGIVMKNEARRQLGYDEVPAGDEFKEEPETELPFSLSKSEPLREDSDYHEFSVQPSDVEELTDEIADEVKTLWEELLDNPEFIAEIKDMITKKKSVAGLTGIFKELLKGLDTIDRIDDLIRTQTTDKALDIVEGLSKDIGLGYDPTGIAAKLEDKAMTFSDKYAERMIDTIRDEVSTGWKEGKSIGQITDGLREKADEFTSYQAERIARTELSRAAGEARHEYALQNQDKLVEVWLATNDHRTRTSHKNMDGKWKHPDEKFKVETEDGIVKVNYPQEEFINCRCDVLLMTIDEVDPDDHAGT